MEMVNKWEQPSSGYDERDHRSVAFRWITIGTRSTTHAKGHDNNSTTTHMVRKGIALCYSPVEMTRQEVVLEPATGFMTGPQLCC